MRALSSSKLVIPAASFRHLKAEKVMTS